MKTSLKTLAAAVVLSMLTAGSAFAAKIAVIGTASRIPMKPNNAPQMICPSSTSTGGRLRLSANNSGLKTWLWKNEMP